MAGFANDMQGKIAQLALKDSTCISELHFVFVSPEIECRLALNHETHWSTDCAHDPDNPVPVTRRTCVVCHGHEIYYRANSGLRHEPRHQNGGIREVSLTANMVLGRGRN